MHRQKSPRDKGSRRRAARKAGYYYGGNEEPSRRDRRIRRGVKSFLGVFAFALLVFPYIQGSTPESKKEMGDQYRFVYERNSSGISDFMIRFPQKGLYDGDTIPVGADSIRTASWLHITQVGGSGSITEFEIFSSAFPDSNTLIGHKDTVSVSPNARGYTFGGCRIDSVNFLQATTGNILHSFLATD